MPLWLKIAAVCLGIAAGLLALDRLGLWMEARGWIYWRKVKPKGSGCVAAGLTAFQELIEPQVRQVIEHRESDHIAERDRNTADAVAAEIKRHCSSGGCEGKEKDRHR